METNHKKSVILRPFVDPKDPIETSHQLGIKKGYRNYIMREYDERNSSGPITPSKNRNIVVIEDSTDEEIPSKAPSEVGEVPNFIQETREEVKRRRRQELQGNYDTEPYVPVMDELLDNQIKHYCVLQQRGLVPLQTNKEFGHERFQRIEEFEG